LLLFRYQLQPFLKRFSWIKGSVHSFRACFCWCNSARAQWWQKIMDSCKKQTSFYLLNTRTICAIFLCNWTQRIDGFSILLQRYVRKGNDAKNPVILNLVFVTERTQWNAAHAQLLGKPIAFEETDFLRCSHKNFKTKISPH